VAGPYRVLSGAIWLALLLGRGQAVWAHGFGQRYDLPVPLWLYVAGAAATVVLSFVVVGTWVRRVSHLHTYPRVHLLQFRLAQVLAHSVVLSTVRLVSVGLFLLLILAGLFGTPNPTRNIAPTLLWVIWWVGLAYLSALLGNLWAIINPLAILYEWAEAAYRLVAPGRELSRHWRYPSSLGVWPGAVLFLVFAWVELVYDDAANPSHLAGFTLVYAALTWLGMWLFGKDTWLRQGEAFSLVFQLLARFSPTEVRVLDPAVCQTCSNSCRDLDGYCIDCYPCFRQAPATQREWNLRPLAVGLARHETITVSQTAFVLLLLATVMFDGLMATPLWVGVERALLMAPPPLGGGNMTVVRTLGLLLVPVLFLELYVMFSFLMAVVSGKRLSATRLACTFTLSLVPIALAYHMAHYFSFLLIHGQRMIPLLSDPLGIGWNVFGTATYRIDIGIVGAGFAWYSAVIAIVLGHVIAVYLAHLIAIRLLRDRTLALRSQYPMLVLMVCYTVISLWILAQPIVEEREHEAAAGGDAYTERLATPTVSLVAYAPAPPPTAPTEPILPTTLWFLAPPQARMHLHTLTGRLLRNAQEAQDFTVCTSGLCYCLEKGPETIRELRRFAGDWYEKGLTALQEQNYDTAVMAFSQTLQRAPRDGRAYFNRSLAYARQAQYQEALTDLTHTLNILPHQAEGYYLRSLITGPGRQYSANGAGCPPGHAVWLHTTPASTLGETT
jgi:hypothetical protein